jgi:hypothetical protein
MVMEILSMVGIAMCNLWNVSKYIVQTSNKLKNDFKRDE